MIVRKGNAVIVRSPERLSFEFDESISFISALYEASYQSDVVDVDFSALIDISESFSLFLLAQIHKIQLDKENGGCFRIICKSSPIYDSFFLNTGFLKSLLNGSCIQSHKQQSISAYGSYTIQSLFKCREHLNLWIKNLMSDFSSVLKQRFPDEQIRAFFEGLSVTIAESLQNISHHAYIESDKLPTYYQFNNAFIHKLFWCFSWHNLLNNKITFILCDLGVGIVDSYSKYSNRPDYDLERLNGMPVHQVMMEALDETKSRFWRGGRGNGLHTIRHKVSELAKVSITIYSNGVLYTKMMSPPYIESINYKPVLPGTWIEWCFEFTE